MQFWRSLVGMKWGAPWNDEHPISDVAFSRERLEEHAESLARAQAITEFPPRVATLRRRLTANAQELYEAHRTIASAAAEGRAMSPAAEWLINNSHIVEEQIRETRLKLPPAYYDQLPKLADGPFAGYPRIFGVAWAYVAHTDSRFDLDLLRSYILAYQRIQPLTIGELWALPLTLQIVLVENLRRAARRVVLSWTQRAEADRLADVLTREPDSASAKLAETRINDEGGKLKAAFVSQLVHRFNDWDSHRSHEWLSTELTRHGATSDDLVRDEHARMGATNTSVRHIIRSMGLIPDVVWPDFVESVSLVNLALNRHSKFAAMDFATRNAYRTVVEQLARRSPRSELEIAESAVSMAEKSSGQHAASDPGYYLLGPGIVRLKSTIRFLSKWSDFPANLTLRSGLTGYIASIVFLAAAMLSLPALALVGQGVSGATIALLSMAGILPAVALAVALVNRAITHEIAPKIIPGLELRDGVPDDARTLVVIPTLLTDAESIDDMARRLEIHHLATQDGNIFYAVASDWTDAAVEVTPQDESLFDAARQSIAHLNARYPAPVGQDRRFYLFHRRRRWNAADRVWMGWERKRGKLHELNVLLRGGQTSFIADHGDVVTAPVQIKYVITLDSDTRLPRDAARRLIGKMLHPLNWPVFEASLQRIVGGYGLLQPRVTPSLPEDSQASAFQRLYSSAGGIDPYAGAVSDVYQDLFGEGSFAGKGIYDVDAFEAATAGRFPDNAVLSHDLLEGLYVRAGLATDIEVVEEFPGRYDVARAREHRWARGDWLLLPWLIAGRSTLSPSTARAPRDGVPALARWKLFDNLRRTVTPIATFGAFTLGWMLPPAAGAIWTASILTTLSLPPLLGVLSAFVSRDFETSLASHIRALGRDVGLALGQALVDLALLADRAYAMTDAIVRALYRRFLSGRRILEWTTAAQAKAIAATRITAYYARMTGGIIFAAVSAGIAASSAAPTLFAWPLVALWLLAPAIACLVSFKRSTLACAPLTPLNRTELRLIARRTWRFFEDFVGEDDHDLPPDNFQEEPRPVVAHRTSPTNIGLYLLSTVSAREFGWISTVEAADRLERTLRTLGKLERFNGHYLNWYDTRALTALEPRYVSSVDSGNLAGHLLAVAAACRRWTFEDDAVIARSGLEDALLLLEREVAALPSRDESCEAALLALRALASRGNVRLDWSSISDIAVNLEAYLEHSVNNPAIAVCARAVAATARSHGAVAELDHGVSRLERRLSAIADAADYTAMAMDFTFLIEPNRELLSIGYAVDAGRLDESCYDLLASEARLASLIAIAKGDLPTRHWFRLGRTILPVHGDAVLSSWSGSMFEYMMPELVTATPNESLLGATMRAAVRQHVRHGLQNGTPWGVSESAYNARDLEFTYQYSAFGVPELGLKRGLGDSHVIAPYATALASLVDPNKAAENYGHLHAIGGSGPYGFYESIDFTPARVAESHKREIIKAYMAHHQGMTVVALANAVLDNVIARTFHQNPMIEAVELLLQERPPRLTPKPARRATLVRVRPEDDELSFGAVRRISLDAARPTDCHFLSNGRLSAVMTASGAGQLRWNGLAITRWQADPTLENLGSFLYLRDRQTGHTWSSAAQPVVAQPDAYEAAFSEDRIQISRRDVQLNTTLDVIISPIDDAICRRLTIVNTSNKQRSIDVTSYEELVLGSAAADAAHPAFSKLFVETSFDEAQGFLTARRRRRGPSDPEILAAAFVSCDVEQKGVVEVETDRAKFIGRSRTLASPISILNGRPLSGTVGAVLDPIFALRQNVIVPPGATVRLAFWTVVADHTEKLMDEIEKHRDRFAYGRCATLAWTHGLVELRHLGVAADEALLFQRIAGCITFNDRALRASEQLQRRGAMGHGPIWKEGISGDLPIAVAFIDEVADIGLIRQLLHAYEYWRSKGLEIDLVIVNDRMTSYQQELQIALESLCQTVSTRHRLGRDNSKGSVYLLRGDLLEHTTRAALPAVARAVFHAKRGSLAEQVDRVGVMPAVPAAPPRRSIQAEAPPQSGKLQSLEFFNGYGGFSEDGREYVITLDGAAATPAPWMNVIANPTFGFMISAEGGGYTWSLNSRERQITPWSNDPVTNRPGEVFYIRDEDTGDFWTPTASPIRDYTSPYVASHGQGYSRFEHVSRGIAATLDQWVAGSDPIKFSRLRLRNTSSRRRQLTVTNYVEWILGSARINTAGNIATAYDPIRKTIFARNPWHHFFDERVAFACISGDVVDWTADRSQFLGRRGGVDNPAGLAAGAQLSRSAGAGIDACSALQSKVFLAPGQEVEILALLGDACDRADAERLVDAYSSQPAAASLAEARALWDGVTGAIQIKTPDRALDILVNRWLPYQTLSSRIWARAGLYQAGGAFGFRDQLQDVMSLTTSRPDIARAHLMTAAGRQFPEGDVQHWWMAPSGHGIRTRIADSCLWLPYAAAHYVTTTGDSAVLDEHVPFLEGPLLRDHEHEVYFSPHVSDESASLYEHCARALDRSLNVGASGLALFGGGDWNDGMNRVGIVGQGESVWLSWFLIVCLKALIPHAAARGDGARAEKWREHIARLGEAIETQGWDGAWYRRGVFDDGSPLGSRHSEECQIDSIAQSWSVFSGVANPLHMRQAMKAVKHRLVDRDAKLMPLFTPPFDASSADPGYIKGYPPGVRENGGQYTHAAIWSLIAFAELADGEAIADLLEILNPINRTMSRADCQLYRVEPYVVAADIYTVGAKRGRGGWSWYTGSAGWLYRAVIEYVLGLRKEGDTLMIAPSMPPQWPGFEATYRFPGGELHITVENESRITSGILAATLDGKSLELRGSDAAAIPLKPNEAIQHVQIKMRLKAAAAVAE
ncbi:MAG: GH36-type glycosyl hydrolase domain-containing protein [Hyphomicrobium sp.]